MRYTVYNTVLQWWQRITAFLKKIAIQERSPTVLATSCAIGVYIAFSPFLMLHTIMIFVAIRLFRLNGLVTFTITHIINNPWTAIPVYMIDYFFGYWIMHSVFNINTESFTPHWIITVCHFFEYKLGITHLCFWSFMIGGNLLGVLLGLITYPIMKRIFTRLSYENSNIRAAYENNCNK